MWKMAHVSQRITITKYLNSRYHGEGAKEEDIKVDQGATPTFLMMLNVVLCKI